MKRQSPPQALERRHAFARHLVTWVGLLCLMAQGSSALHMLLVEHVRCAEHGEWVHADQDHHRVHSADLGAQALSGLAIAASDAEEDHGHEHCLVGSERRKTAVSPLVALELRLQTRDSKAALLGVDASVPKAHTYALAPKTSPPV